MRPSGELLCRVATVNDLHFGEITCGLLDGVSLGPPLQSEPGEEPYPTVMNAAAAKEIAAIGPDAVVAKGDLTSEGTASEYAQFEAVYRPAFGPRLLVTLGNHDKPVAGGGVPAVPLTQSVVLQGVTLAVLDTSRRGLPGGQVSAEQTEWLDDLSAQAESPVLVFGHHPLGGADLDLLFGPGSGHFAGLDASSSERLMQVVARRSSIVGYFAGHTHRNKVRHNPGTGSFPWVEVACVKDYPGSWAEYQIYEGGIVQLHHRISSDPAALRWSERCRDMFGGHYPAYALGQDSDRTFAMPART